jgi:DnaD/phage-associated family protein
MANYWIKLYIEILNDSKMAILPDRLWRRTVELFAAAGHYNDKGNLPDTQQLAWLLRMGTDDLEFDLKQIAITGIIQRTTTGWLVTKFEDRQAPVPGNERVKQYRDRQKKQQYYSDVTEMKRDVTQITDTDTDTDTEEEEEEDSKRPNIFAIYESNIGSITKIMADKLIQAEKDYSEEWITEAVSIAVANNARKWSYVEAILKDWQANGYKNDKRKPVKANSKSSTEPAGFANLRRAAERWSGNNE